VTIEVHLGPADQFDHPLIGLAGGVAPGQKPVPHPDHPGCGGTLFIGGNRSFGELKAGLDVIDHNHFVSQGLVDNPFPFLLVGQCKHRIGVGVVDESGGKESVNQGFDRRVWRTVVDQVSADFAHHFLIGESLELS
jgi:hypothetical protein